MYCMWRAYGMRHIYNCCDTGNRHADVIVCNINNICSFMSFARKQQKQNSRSRCKYTWRHMRYTKTYRWFTCYNCLRRKHTRGICVMWRRRCTNSLLQVRLSSYRAMFAHKYLIEPHGDGSMNEGDATDLKTSKKNLAKCMSIDEECNYMRRMNAPIPQNFAAKYIFGARMFSRFEFLARFHSLRKRAIFLELKIWERRH